MDAYNHFKIHTIFYAFIYYIMIKISLYDNYFVSKNEINIIYVCNRIRGTTIVESTTTSNS